MITKSSEFKSARTSGIASITPLEELSSEIAERIFNCISSYIYPISDNTTQEELIELGIVGIKIEEANLSFSKNSINLFNEIKGLIIDLNRSNLKSLFNSDFYDRAILTFSGELIPLTAEEDAVISDMKNLEIIK